uniref:Beta-defensin-like domain-containing protein n=1 Tax=Ficedula albicollis TaxID=59894 RepID=A0A803V466_FICAL
LHIQPIFILTEILFSPRPAGLSPVRASAQECERRGGFCSQRSCPPGIGRVGLCSEQEFCCRM